MCYSLPKCWQGRIQKYWDKLLPSNYPASSSMFSIKYENEEITNAVNLMEEQLGTDDSIVLTMIPEGNNVSSYVGTFDVTGEVGTLTLLCPNKVESDNVVVMHYVDGQWVKVEDFQIIDGYVWGILDSFSPIAVFEYKKEIHMVESYAELGKVDTVVCEGNAVQVKYNDNNQVVVVNPATGKEIPLVNKNSAIVGGSIDGSHVDSTSVTIIGIPAGSNLKAVYAGSAYIEKDVEKFTTVDSVNAYVVDSTFSSITGAVGAVRANNVNIVCKNSKLISHVACGQSMMSAIKVDAGELNPTFASRAWVKKSKIVLENTDVYIIYGAGNSGNLYCDETELVMTGCTNGTYTAVAGSNGYTKIAKAIINGGTDIKMLEFQNRGGVGFASASIVDSKIDLLSIGGDNKEGDVDGVIDTIKLEIGAGKSDINVVLGVNGNENITADAVESVKISRNAGNITVDPLVIDVLGNKYVVK